MISTTKTDTPPAILASAWSAAAQATAVVPATLCNRTNVQRWSGSGTSCARGNRNQTYRFVQKAIS